MNLNRAPYSSTVAVPVDLLGAPWVGEEGGELASHYYRARYYDSKLARFLGEDPIGLVRRPNLYRYVANIPTLLTDPTGLIEVPWYIKVPWDAINIPCLIAYWNCTKAIKRFCRDKSGEYGTYACEFDGFECCNEELNRCRMYIFRSKADPERAPRDCPRKTCP